MTPWRTGPPERLDVRVHSPVLFFIPTAKAAFTSCNGRGISGASKGARLFFVLSRISGVAQHGTRPQMPYNAVP